MKRPRSHGNRERASSSTSVSVPLEEVFMKSSSVLVPSSDARSP